MPNKENQLKFPNGTTTEPLLIENAVHEEHDHGSTYVVYIKQLITGEDHFLPSDGLIDKLKKENVDKGDKITIEKVKPSDKWKFGYFVVVVVEKNTQNNTIEKAAEPTHKSVEKFEKQFETKNDNISLHELTVRVEKLEKMATLWSCEAGLKPGDEELPF